MAKGSLKFAEPQALDVEIESPRPRETASIESVVGPDKGRVFELDSARMTIGRADENDIVVTSEGISRTHAFLGKTNEGWFIRDNQSKNGIQVNGKKVTESWLSEGDVVQVGSFVFKFREARALAVAEPAPSANDFATAGLDLNQGAPLGTGMDLGGGMAPLSAPKKPNRRVLIYTVVALFLGGLYFVQNQSEETKAPTDDKKMARDFELSKEPTILDPAQKEALKGIEDPELGKAETEMQKLDWSNSSLREAEQFFRRGQREYLSKNYNRAIDQFQTALSLYRGHRLAEKYLRLTYYEAEVKAKQHMAMGIQYFQSLQYQRAIFHFTEVIGLMQHRATEPIVGESERYISLSKRRLQAAELFP